MAGAVATVNAAIVAIAVAMAIVTAATEVGSQQHPIVLMHSGKASHESNASVSPNRSNTVAALPAPLP